MPPFARREFSGNATPTTITSTITAGDLTINIASSTGWPTGATGPFIVTIDQGLATEEKLEILSRTGLVLTVTPTGRGHDSTAAVGHSAGAKIEHTMAARDLSEANAHNADVTRDDHTQYLNAARHDARVHDIDTTELQDGAVTYAKLAAGQRDEPGDFKWGFQTADHTGWLLCDGRAVSITTYAALWAALGSAHLFGANPGGGNFLLPDLRKKGLLGKTASGFGSTLGATVGTADAVLVAHTHTVNDHTHGFSTGTESNYHNHNMEGHQHDFNHDHQTARGSDAAEIIQFGGSSEGLTGTNKTMGATADVGHAGRTSGPNTTTTGGAGWFGGAQNNNQLHTHSGTTGGASNRGADTPGVSATDANIQPSVVANGFIHT